MLNYGEVLSTINLYLLIGLFYVQSKRIGSFRKREKGKTKKTSYI